MKKIEAVIFPVDRAPGNWRVEMANSSVVMPGLSRHFAGNKERVKFPTVYG